MFDIPAGVEILHGRVHESFPFNGQVYARSCTTRFFGSLRASFRCEWWTSKISRQQHEHVLFSIGIPNGKEGLASLQMNVGASYLLRKIAMLCQHPYLI